MDKPVASDRALLLSAIEGLSEPQKRLEAKWFYDLTGSVLFEEITQLPEYYPTRTEAAILSACAGDLATVVPPGGALIELGSGASVKTRLLLDACHALGSYVPTDISGDFLMETAQGLRQRYPDLAIRPLVADFLSDIPFPPDLVDSPKTAFFPGSTLGNLTKGEAIGLLRRVRDWPGVGGFILGLDLVKDRDMLLRAYDDSAGVTAAFNLNILRRLNRDAGGGFELDRFAHQARWNEGDSRIEMHLVSRDRQTVLLGGQAFQFEAGESIHTENSHKYTRTMIEEMAGQGGWTLSAFHTDANDLFSVCVLRPS